MQIALANLELDNLFVIYPGSRSHELAEWLEVLPFADLAKKSPTLHMRRSSS